MDSIKIFDDLACIITHDYAGAEELRHPQAHIPFLKFCSDRAEHFGLEDRDLYQYIQLYLDVIGGKQLVFDIKDYAGFQHTGRGFSTRSNGTDLFVVETGQEERMKPGDRILQLNQYKPAEFRRVSTFTAVERPLSDRDRWDAYLNLAKFVMVERSDGSREKVILKEYPLQENAPVFECRALEADVTYLRIDSFADPDMVNSWVESNASLASNCSRLIVDLRWNRGGSLEAAQSLIPFTTDRDISAGDFYQIDPTCTRYSERNCDLYLSAVRPYLNSPNPAMVGMAQSLIDEFQSRRGMGLQPAPQPDGEKGSLIPSRRSARQLIILTDTGTADEAEWFCLAARRMTGIRLIGRPTGGSIDYSNPVTVDYGFGVTFSYPISKTQSCINGDGLNPTGIPVDVPIPWTPAEVKDDLILKAALEY